MPPQPSTTGTTDATRLDVRQPLDVADPTVVTDPRRDGTRAAWRQQVPVSPIGMHTGGLGTVRAAADRLNRALDAREAQAAADRVTPGTASRAWRRQRNRKVSLRDAAARRAAARMRHERHMEVVETLRAYLGVACLVALLALVGAMAYLAFGILAGWYTWMPVR